MGGKGDAVGLCRIRCGGKDGGSTLADTEVAVMRGYRSANDAERDEASESFFLLYTFLYVVQDLHLGLEVVRELASESGLAGSYPHERSRFTIRRGVLLDCRIEWLDVLY